MHDLVNNKLPGSFEDIIPITNKSNYDITTRWLNLPNNNFANIWNEFDQIYQKCKPKNKAKKLLRKQLIDSYLNTVRCHKFMCNECNKQQH